jgi:hypothetical protein
MQAPSNVNHSILSPSYFNFETKSYLLASLALAILAAAVYLARKTPFSARLLSLPSLAAHLFQRIFPPQEEYFDAQEAFDEEEIFFDCENPREMMGKTMRTIWSEESKVIEKIWSAMMKGASIEQWIKLEEHRFRLQLAKDIEAAIEGVPATLIMPKEMDILFSEKEQLKILTFPDQAISGVRKTFFGNVFLASLKEIRVASDNVKVVAALPISSAAVDFTHGEAFDLWNKAVWTS